MFDEYLRARAERTGEPFREFDLVSDYDTYVDGKPRADGVRSFLESRGIELKEGGADDPPSTETIAGLGNRKNELVLKLIDEQGVEAYEGSVALRQGGDRGGPAPRRRLLEHQLPGGARGGRDRRPVRGDRRRPRRRARGARRASRRRTPSSPAPGMLGVEPLGGGRLRGRARRGRGRPRGRLRLRRRRRPGRRRPRRGARRARRRHRRQRPRGAAASDPPRRLRRRALGGPRVASSTSTCWPSRSPCSRSPTATSGCAGTSTRASPTGSPAPI